MFRQSHFQKLRPRQRHHHLDRRKQFSELTQPPSPRPQPLEGRGLRRSTMRDSAPQPSGHPQWKTAASCELFQRSPRGPVPIESVEGITPWFEGSEQLDEGIANTFVWGQRFCVSASSMAVLIQRQSKGIDQYLRPIVQSYQLRLNHIDAASHSGAGASNAVTSH